MKRSGDLSCYVLPKSLSSYAAYDFSDQEPICHAVISVLAARLPIGCLCSEQLNDQVPVQQLLLGYRLVKPKHARLMGQQPANRCLGFLCLRELGPVRRNRRVEIKLPPIR